MTTQAKKITPVVIAIIVNQDGKILMTDRKFTHPKTEDPQVRNKDFWQFPGGEVNIGETLEEAVKREIKEEVNIDIEIKQQLPYTHTSLRPFWHGILHYFLCQPTKDSYSVRLNHESTRFAWYYPHEVKDLLTFADTHKALKIALDYFS